MASSKESNNHTIGDSSSSSASTRGATHFKQRGSTARRREQSKEKQQQQTSWTVVVVRLGTFLLCLFLGILSPPLIHSAKLVHLMGGFSKLPQATSPRLARRRDESFVDKANEDNPNQEEATTTRHSRSCDLEENQEEYNLVLSKDDVYGMHTLCSQITDHTLHIYANSRRQPTPHHFEKFNATSDSWKRDFFQILEFTLRLSRQPNRLQPWALFTTQGVRITDEQALLRDSNEELWRLLQNGSTLVLMEGGQWVWPGISIGYIREIALDANRNATLETLSLNPLVLAVHRFLSDEECTWIQTTAEPHMTYSQVTLTDQDQGRAASDFRTSQSYFLGPEHYIDGKLQQIDVRTSQLVRIPRIHQEYVQVLRYGIGERYVAHLDYFDPQHYQQDQGTLDWTKHGQVNRHATVFWYLSDVEAGGETVFPRFNFAPLPTDFGDCSVGLKVTPQRGKVIIFYSMTAQGLLNPMSLHGACPVQQGVKWAANKWVWNRPQGDLTK